MQIKRQRFEWQCPIQYVYNSKENNEERGGPTESVFMSKPSLWVIVTQSY
jgi:hypothetical protein